ncbi:MAG: thioredoxin family protein [Rickettsiales bacterium]
MQNGFKYFDRILNVVLVVIALAWAYDHFIVKKSPEGKVAEAQSLSMDAQAAFGDAENTSSVLPAKKGDPEPVTFTQSGIVPTDFDKATKEILNSDVPVLLFIYTSWCPYCNKLYPEIESVANERQDSLKIVAVSVDKSEYAFQRYMNGKPSAPPFIPYYLGNGKEYSRLINYLQLEGFNFNGGIPFMAFFSHGKPAGQIGGYVEKDKIDRILEQIYADTSTTEPSKPSL